MFPGVLVLETQKAKIRRSWEGGVGLVGSLVAPPRCVETRNLMNCVVLS